MQHAKSETENFFLREQGCGNAMPLARFSYMGWRAPFSRWLGGLRGEGNISDDINVGAES
jgi:hypothetical protein